MEQHRVFKNLALITFYNKSFKVEKEISKLKTIMQV